MAVLDKSVIPLLEELINKMYQYAPEDLQEQANRMIYLLDTIPQ